MKQKIVHALVVFGLMVISGCGAGMNGEYSPPAQTATSTEMIGQVMEWHYQTPPLREATNTRTITPTRTITLTRTIPPTPEDTPTVSPEYMDMQGYIMFDLEITGSQGVDHMMYIFQFPNQSIMGFLHGVFQDETNGVFIIWSDGTRLWPVGIMGTGGETPCLTSDLFYWGTSSATFLPNGDVVFLKGAPGSLRIVQIDTYYRDETVIAEEADLPAQPISFLLPIENNRLLWAGGTCSAQFECEFDDGIFMTDLQTGNTTSLPGVLDAELASDGERIAYTMQTEDEHSQLVVSPVQDLQGGFTVLDFEQARISDFTWFGSNIGAIVESDGSLQYYFIDLSTGSVEVVAVVHGTNGRVFGSPDESNLLFTAAERLPDGTYRIGLRLWNVETHEITLYENLLGEPSQDPIEITNLMWPYYPMR